MSSTAIEGLQRAGFLVLGVVDPSARTRSAKCKTQRNLRSSARALEVGVRHPFLVEAQPLAALCQHLQKKIRATRKTGERVEANMPLDPG